ncbi:hypothetical protein Y032_0188g1157 [Ancylostoma ceylanicum]|uniref:Uncharacterized protein n=1 Tax=Ancylostoma ceylanicum TaxID=53326 RepID=A0A016SRG4_9BILA|nr:hypothetical protein Y032_0188g1157 [Ancylostoma ceylanicum]
MAAVIVITAITFAVLREGSSVHVKWNPPTTKSPTTTPRSGDGQHNPGSPPSFPDILSNVLSGTGGNKPAGTGNGQHAPGGSKPPSIGDLLEYIVNG